MSIFAGKTPYDYWWNRFFRQCGFESFLRTDIGEIRIFHGMKRSRMICVTNIR